MARIFGPEETRNMYINHIYTNSQEPGLLRFLWMRSEIKDSKVLFCQSFEGTHKFFKHWTYDLGTLRLFILFSASEGIIF